MKARLLGPVVLLALLTGLVVVMGAAGAKPACSDPAGCITIAPGAPVNLGTFLVLGDPFGDDQLNGIEIALDLRGRTFLGHQIRLVNSGAGCNFDAATREARVFANTPGLVGVIGGSCSGATFMAGQVLGPRGVMMVSPSATGPFLTTPDAGMTYFARTAPNDLLQPRALARFVRNVLGLRTAATIAWNEDFTQELAAEFRSTFTSLKGRITGRADVDPESADFGAVLQTLGSPAFVYGALFDPDDGALAQAARPAFEVGLTDAALFNPAVAAVDGVYSHTHDTSGTSAAYFDSFLPAYVARFGDPPAEWHTLAADATNILLDAAASVARVSQGSITIGRSALRSAVLATRNYPGLAGTLTCSANGECNPNGRVTVFRSQNGAFEPVWP